MDVSFIRSMRQFVFDNRNISSKGDCSIDDHNEQDGEDDGSDHGQDEDGFEEYVFIFGLSDFFLMEAHIGFGLIDFCALDGRFLEDDDIRL